MARRFDSRVLCIVALAVFKVLPSATLRAAEPEPRLHRPPNVIFILADDLGYGDLGCFGQKKIRTPHIDQMAAEGIRFTQHYAGSPVCVPQPAAR